MAFADPEREREWRRLYREQNRERFNEYRRQWRAANPDKGRAEYRRYREKNRDKELERKRAFREQNREKVNEQARRLRELNPERHREAGRQYTMRNRERVRLAGMIHIHGPLYPVVFAEMWLAQEGRCYLCHRDLERSRVHMDHDHRCCPADASCSLCRRGLACPDCNTLIGRAGDDPQRLRLIADNLEQALIAVDIRLAEKPEQQTLLLGVMR